MARQPATSAPSTSRLTAEQRADALLRQMTIDEKAIQLSSVFPLALFDTRGTNHSQLDALLKNGIGHVSALGLIGHKTPKELAHAVNAIQRYLLTETRLKIPAIFHNEAMSGVVAPQFTAFPTSIGLAATWDPAGIEAMADIIRRQMRTVGMLQALAPVMDVARDARWGRVSETYGEDPYLVSAMSVAYTRGLQGNDLTKGVLATAKHFVGYALTEGGQNMAATAVGARELYDVHARPFEAAFRLAAGSTSSPTTRRRPSPRRSGSSCRRRLSLPSQAPVWFPPSGRTFRRQSLPPVMPTSSSSRSAADRHGRTSAPKEKALTRRTRTSRRSRHGHRRDVARAAAHWVHPRGPRARCVEDRLVRGAR